MSELFTPLTLRGVTLKNRIVVSPMCQYSSDNGLPTDWHKVHLGSRAIGGAAMVMVEASAVTPEGRISPWDSGIWSDRHAETFEPIVQFMKSQNCIAAIQLAHAGRKGSTDVPWRGGKKLAPDQGGWQPIAPSAIPFDRDYPMPRQMTSEDIRNVIGAFGAAARRSIAAGFEVVELHVAHGYLLHEFLSPLSNHRDDKYGGSLENRMRLPLEATEAVRRALPDGTPLFVRISATDWAEGGWDLEQSIALVKRLKPIGVDLIDCSSGGLVPAAKIEIGPGYQVPFAEAIRKQVGIATGAVGMITEAQQAERIIARQQADVVLMARQFVRDPYFALHAADELGVDVPWPIQYARAKPHRR